MGCGPRLTRGDGALGSGPRCCRLPHRVACAWQLRELLEPLPGKTRVNLIPYNVNEGLGAAGALFLPSPPEAVKAFQRQLLDHGVICTVRTARGDDEAAACGQLATKRKR
eukprot:4047155-Prymnesium_polylepis.1